MVNDDGEKCFKYETAGQILINLKVEQDILNDAWIYFKLPEDYLTLEHMMLFSKAIALYQKGLNYKDINNFSLDLPLAVWKEESEHGQAQQMTIRKIEKKGYDQNSRNATIQSNGNESFGKV